MILGDAGVEPHDPPDNVSQVAYLRAIEGAAPIFGVELARADVRNAAEIERAIIAFAQQPNTATKQAAIRSPRQL